VTILDTFFLLFEADASALDKGLTEARAKAKKTTEEVQKTDAAAFKMGQSLGNAIAQAGGAILAGLSIRAMAQALMTAADAADLTTWRTRAKRQWSCCYLSRRPCREWTAKNPAP